MLDLHPGWKFLPLDQNKMVFFLSVSLWLLCHPAQNIIYFYPTYQNSQLPRTQSFIIFKISHQIEFRWGHLWSWRKQATPHACLVRRIIILGCCYDTSHTGGWEVHGKQHDHVTESVWRTTQACSSPLSGTQAGALQMRGEFTPGANCISNH